MKSILIICMVIFSVTYLAAGVVRTATMDSVLVENLREAVDSDGINDDEVMDFYYDKLNPYSARYEEGEDDWRENRASYKPIDGASYFANRAFLGAVDVELPDTTFSPTFLDWGKRYLLEPDFYIPGPDEDKLRYLDLDSLWVEVADGHARNCFILASILTNCGVIVDMLYHYVEDEDDRIALCDSLDNVANFVNILLNVEYNDANTIYDEGNVRIVIPDYYVNSDEWDDRYPIEFGTRTNNYRIMLASALGYAGCVHI